MDRAALINYLSASMQTLHAEDQRLHSVLLRVQASRSVGPDDFEALIDAQRAALRIPANALLMLVGVMEADERATADGRGQATTGERAQRPMGSRAQPGPPAVTLATRLRRAVRAFRGP